MKLWLRRTLVLSELYAAIETQRNTEKICKEFRRDFEIKLRKKNCAALWLKFYAPVKAHYIFCGTRVRRNRCLIPDLLHGPKKPSYLFVFVYNILLFVAILSSFI